MRVGIHQPNFCPHFGFFYKMSMCDIFVILSQVQFEKNGFQNRYRYDSWPEGKWVTNPVNGGLDEIYKKSYTNGESLIQVNMDFIFWAKKVLGIETKIVQDVVTDSKSTQRLIDNLNHYGATSYVTNPSAKDKYLDESMIKSAGIDLVYCKHPNEKMNLLEMFDNFGIVGTRKQLYQKQIVLKEIK